jgi:squalene-hopene/tetraprenyl-beta-curcumene cyclase
LIFAGLTKDDPRVKAAVEWLAKHYTFTENPGMGDAGLYYYLQTAAKALDTLGEETFTDAVGVKHTWRNELAEVLITRQQPNGSWVNQNPRWMEGDSNLVTSYALLALASCRPKP